MNNKTLKVALLSVAVVLACLFGAFQKQKWPLFHGDALGYYIYLPATFIYHNFTSLEKAPAEGIPVITHSVSPKGYTVNQYTYGVALMELPFFLIAHGYEKLMGLPANGYSPTYDALIRFASFSYAFLGLLLLYPILRRYFSSLHSLIGILLIFLGSNLFWFSLYHGGMSHTPLFFLYAALMSLTISLHERASLKLFIITGLVVGLITIIRPSDVICVLIPLLYNVYNKRSLLDKIQFIKTNFSKIIIAGCAAIIPFIPQILYWRYITGAFFYDSYKGQTFNWKTPRIIEGLFYGNNGWLMYSPVMICAVLGLLFYKRILNWAGSLYVLLPLYIYIIYSWYCYNYINGLGSRPMIHVYPLLAIPFVAFIVFISKKNTAVKIALG